MDFYAIILYTNSELILHVDLYVVKMASSIHNRGVWAGLGDPQALQKYKNYFGVGTLMR